MATKVGIIGSGGVGKTLANGFVKHGYAVMMGSREGGKLEDWKGQIGTFAEAAAFGDVVVLVVKGSAAEPAIELCGENNLRGKIVIDATNPISDEPPQNGVLRFFTNINESMMERLQKKMPQAKFVKAFNSVGQGLMINPDLPGGPPSMFICGNDGSAKTEVRQILKKFGWETEDMGPVEAARAIEPLCILWCIPAFTKKDFSHAFKMLRKA